MGNTSDIEAIAKVCNKYNILLFWDNAHGAYLTCGDNHPLKLGASMCCDSAHKTLPVLTGGAYLHLSEGCPFSKDEAKAKMALFSSTSPSYLILTSLDLCNRYLCESANGDFEVLRKKISQIKRLMDEKNIAYLDNKVDFAKITIDAFQIGSDGATLAKLLSQYQIEPEYTNEYYVVLLTTPFLKEADWNRLEDALHAIQVRSPKDREEPAYALPKSILHSYQTLGLPSSYVPIDEAVNQISAQTIATCPPGVPIITAGEEINEQIKNICKKCGNFRIKVLK